MQHEKYTQLAFQTTLHCLTGCGVGDIVGVVIATIFGLPYLERITAGIIFGFVFGFLFSLIPLLKSQIGFITAAKIILTTELISILVMEAAEAATELLFPGMRRLGVLHLQYWLGLFSALVAGFIFAYPVNYLLVKKGVRHHH